MRFCAFIGSTVVACAAAGVSGSIVSVGGDAVVVEPPTDIRRDVWESDTEIRVWDERETVLGQELNLGHSRPGLVNDLSQLDGDTVPAGTPVRSFMIRYDPVGLSEPIVSGYVEFSTDILGVYIKSQLDGTDAILGRESIEFYNKNDFRGLELNTAEGTVDSFDISVDRRRIDFVMRVTGWTDDIRVVTVVPSPGLSGLLPLAAGCFARRRRR